MSTQERSEKRAASAKYAFNLAVRQYHVPAGDATNDVERGNLLTNAVVAYRDILKRYPDQPRWDAQTLRSLGNAYLALGRPADALDCYDRVGREYPGEDWEVIQAWKSAADLLWAAGARDRAAKYFERIVEKYDAPEMPPMFHTLVDISKARLEGIGVP